MLTNRQERLYWITWEQVCAAQGWKRNDSDRRYALHIHCKCPQSMKDFVNKDFNKFLSGTASFRDAIDIRDRDRENALHTIRKNADQPYVERICFDLYQTKNYESLPMDKLENLRNTIHNRAYYRKRSSRAAKKTYGDVPPGNCPF